MTDVNLGGENLTTDGHIEQRRERFHHVTPSEILYPSYEGLFVLPLISGDLFVYSLGESCLRIWFCGSRNLDTTFGTTRFYVGY